MPNIFKNILGAVADEYVFQNVDTIDVGELPEDEGTEQGDEENDILYDEDGEVMLDEDGEPLREVNRLEHSETPLAVSYATIQADEIIADARKRAEAIVSEAATGAKLIKFSAENEIKQAREQAFEQGYTEGVEKARLEMGVKLEMQVKEFLENAVLEKDTFIEKTQIEMCELALAVAEKVIQISLQSSKEVIARMIQVATEKLKRREWVRIYISEIDAHGIVESAPELTAALAGISDNVKIIPLKDGESGTCIIEMPDEIIDAGVSTQMTNIRATINHV